MFIREAKRALVDMEGNRGYYTENEWILDTEGVNLLDVMCHPDVDYTRTVSNHLMEIIEVLGIEAARNALMKVRLLRWLLPPPSPAWLHHISAALLAHLAANVVRCQAYAAHKVMTVGLPGDARCDRV